MKPIARTGSEGIQLSYEVPHPIHDAKVYPRKSANGSTVIVYGHENGVRVIWYAGKPFKKPTGLPQATPKVNGTSSNDAMVIDLNDDDEEEEQSEPAKLKPAEFEEEGDEIDPLRPHADILRYLEIPLGSAAMHIAIPSIPSDLDQMDQQSYPGPLLNRILLAVACVDLSIRLLAVPLDPPHPDVVDAEDANVKTVKFFGPDSHQDQVTNISMSYTGSNADNEDTDSRSRGRPTEAQITGSQQIHWSLLIASVSCTGSGLLLIHQIPLGEKNILSRDPGHLYPLQRQFLRAPLQKCRLHFNPSPYPAERHSTLLVAIHETGQTKIYQPFHDPIDLRGRRASGATTDSAASSTRSSRALTKQSGRFLITLLPKFDHSSTTDLCPRRKRVLDANWVLNGRSVLALFEDGEWGIWDIEAVGPSSTGSGSNPLRGEGNISGIQGGSLTKFSVQGTIRSKEEAATTKVVENNTSHNALAPMTPHTRKVRSQGLFAGETDTQRPQAQEESGQLNGSVLVSEITSSKPFAANKTMYDECVVLKHGTQSLLIPDVQAYWRFEVNKKGAFDASSTKPILLPQIRLGGESARAFSLLPTSSTTQQSIISVSDSTPDFLVATTTRLILFVQPIAIEGTEDAGTNKTRPVPLRNQDQMLLSVGELDVDGMDRILDNMAQGASNTQTARPNFGKSVGFADDDVHMSSPTPGRQTRLKLGKATGTPRRLFT